MKARNFKRWIAGFCATAMLAGAPAMVGYATALNDTTETGNTTVTAFVIANDNQPTYAIVIPDTVDFGQIQLPATDTDSYVTTKITVQCKEVSGLASDQAISVLVKDSNAQSAGDSFLLKNQKSQNALWYDMLNEAGQSIQDPRKWSADDYGYLCAAFTEGGQNETLTLRLNKAQLSGKDLSMWGGPYSGTLNFTTRISDSAELQSMENGTPVM